LLITIGFIGYRSLSAISTKKNRYRSGLVESETDLTQKYHASNI
jgi:hypothetical protein